MKRNPKVTAYLNTLKLIPRDIFLDIWMREFNEADAYRCICGWAVRLLLANCTNEAILQTENCPNSNTQESEMVKSFTGVMTPSVNYNYAGTYLDVLVDRLGGTLDEWHALFNGAAFDTVNVETAVVLRLNQLVRVR